MTKSWKEGKEVHNRVVVMVLPNDQKKNLHTGLNLYLLYAVCIKIDG